MKWITVTNVMNDKKINMCFGEQTAVYIAESMVTKKMTVGSVELSCTYIKFINETIAVKETPDIIKQLIAEGDLITPVFTGKEG